MPPMPKIGRIDRRLLTRLQGRREGCGAVPDYIAIKNRRRRVILVEPATYT